ncbi:metallophosphoesterase [candidate division KSB1 bacterium]|nr:metallophosphoesterase [candidate division KSB1 bacterium]
MHIGVMSDSHDNLPKIKKAVTFFNENNIELVIHSGDIVSPFAAKELLLLRSKSLVVYGNNDGERLGLSRILGDTIHLAPYQIKIAEKKVLICHEPYALQALIDSKAYNCIIYGHTHEIDVRQENGVLVLNPGECGGWLTNRSTIATWDLETNEVEIIEF